MDNMFGDMFEDLPFHTFHCEALTRTENQHEQTRRLAALAAYVSPPLRPGAGTPMLSLPREIREQIWSYLVPGTYIPSGSLPNLHATLAERQATRHASHFATEQTDPRRSLVAMEGLSSWFCETEGRGELGLRKVSVRCEAGSRFVSGLDLQIRPGEELTEEGEEGTEDGKDREREIFKQRVTHATDLNVRPLAGLIGLQGVEVDIEGEVELVNSGRAAIEGGRREWFLQDARAALMDVEREIRVGGGETR
ncbi:hypothetical protein DL98DRAFT_650611 [Cadophora sp. DSE1049]|nr:hypothetical protein DL98DRAFT_650611 [Cadophora sp. DSE1049]